MLDALKGMACSLIVWHHLAFYGPMSDAALPLAPDLIAWLYDHGRLAVQVFLVLAGYLAASALAPAGKARFGSAWGQIRRRYSRLVPPYLVALLVTLLVAASLRPWFAHESVPQAPQWLQLLAHGLLLQGLLGFESLSAGVWYIAIDMQLFALTVLTLASLRALGQRLRLGAAWFYAAVLALVLASLFYFNLDAQWDETALYFYGAYGLGLLSFWACRSSQPRSWLLALALLGLLALQVEFRSRLAIALLTALWLGLASLWPRWQLGLGQLAWLQALGQISYSVFLIHFPVLLLVNALVHSLWPGLPWHNLLGMLLAFVLSLAAGAVLHRKVESRSWWLAPRWPLLHSA